MEVCHPLKRMAKKKKYIYNCKTLKKMLHKTKKIPNVRLKVSFYKWKESYKNESQKSLNRMKGPTKSTQLMKERT